MFDPDSITQDQLQELQRAAQLAWGEDTRHPSFQDHPDASQGQCLVTSRWLKKRLGQGFVGTKNGHFFWVSPDKRYTIDLTGDKYSKSPYHPSIENQQDENGEQIRLDPHHHQWMVGPSVYVRSDHPEYRDFRIVDDSQPHPRSDIFEKRADAYMRNQMPKEADLLGPTAYPDSTPQKQEDWVNNGPMLHDEAQPTSMSSDQQYTFVIANGELHVDPARSHQDLLGLAGLSPEATGPMAFGYADIVDGKVTWYVTTNMSTNTVHQMLSEYSDNMGWGFEGMMDSSGNPIHEDYGSKQSMWYDVREDGHLILSHRPLKRGTRLTIVSKNVYTVPMLGPARAALQEWAQDFGYKISEYPGGGNMLDKMKVMPNLDEHNLGDQDAVPEVDWSNINQAEGLECPVCGARFDHINELISHDKEYHHPDAEHTPTDNLPWRDDMDDPLGFGTWPYPTGSEGLGGG